jgi:hypothetical protein
MSHPVFVSWVSAQGNGFFRALEMNVTISSRSLIPLHLEWSGLAAKWPCRYGQP